MTHPVQRLAHAVQAGYDAANALQSGDVYKGASEAAKACGYADGSPEFVCCFYGYAVTFKARNGMVDVTEWNAVKRITLLDPPI